MELGPLWIAAPLGLLGLLGVPAVLLIHLLQTRPRPTPTSTLFLWEVGRRPVSAGRSLSPLVASLQLVLRLLAVLLFTWLLADPRALRSGGELPVALLVDTSASMSAFRAPADRAIQGLLARLGAQPLALRLVEVGGAGRTLYAGANPAELQAALKRWRPSGGAGDPKAALGRVQAALGAEALAVWITDHPRPLEGAVPIGVGRPTDNVGFSSLEATPAAGGRWGWRATVDNHGDQPAERTLRTEGEGLPSKVETLRLAPGERLSLQGQAPAEVRGLSLRLSEDALPLDDHLPIAQPKPKTVFVHGAAPPPLDRWLVAAGARLGGGADLTVVPADHRRWPPALGPTLGVAAPAKSTPRRGLIAGEDPWTRGLVFGDLAVRPAPSKPPKDATPILWLEGAPVAWRGPQPSLYLGFQPAYARVHPALFALVSRFLAAVERRKIAPSAVNLELSEPLRLPLPPPAPAVQGAHWVDGSLIAPAQPGWFSAAWQGRPLVYGAAHFAALREADLRRAAHQDPPALLLPPARRARLRPPLPPWILQLFLLGLLLASYATRAPRPRA